MPDAGRAAARPAPAPRAARRLRAVPDRPLRVCDVALFYAPRSGGIRTYLDAKIAWARASGAIEHHVMVPGRGETHVDGIHTLPSVVMGPANGYRLPLGVRALQETLEAILPDVVLLHDPFWGPVHVTRAAHALGAKVVAVHHGSAELDAAGLPGPAALHVPVLRRWLRHAYAPVDAVMSVVDPEPDCGRPADLPLGLGLDPAFRPRPEVPREDHVLYVGRLAREKGCGALLDAAARSPEPYELHLVGTGPLEDRLRRRAGRLGIQGRVRLHPFEADREALARRYAGARAVVMPGEHETFGLVGLEAAASGARVVACTTAPAAAACGNLVHTFAPGDVAGLARAIGAARAAPADPVAAGRLADRHAWPRLLEAERRGLAELTG